ncbi:MAG: DUF6046 domain-containing protein [Prevotellaceae bacterium]|jgi:hypothetical protein|nr:DUF6046 domain-containing protein [Prevotellaceae bacterium]
MGLLVISLLSKYGRQEWYRLKLTSDVNQLKSNDGIDYGNVLDGKPPYGIDSGATYEKTLRVPSIDGYENSLTAGAPRNNIVLRAAVDGKTYEIEFTDAKCKVVKENKIIETPIVNRRGTVKEYINAKDYSITISGNLFVKLKEDFPVEAVKMLNRLLSTTESIEVSSAYLSFFEITKMVFKNGTFDQKEAKYVNVMPFSLEFVSDEDYEFLVEDNS